MRDLPPVRSHPRPVLRQRILTLTVIPLMAASFAALLLVHLQVDRRMRSHLRSELDVAQAVLENLLATRADDLRIRADMLARDPKFFAMMTIPPEERTPEFIPSVAELVAEKVEATGADVIEIFSPDGELLTAAQDAGDAAPLPPESTREDIERALAGEAAGGVAVRGDALYQTAAARLLAGGQVVGALRIGRQLDHELAVRAQELAGAEVAFQVGSAVVAASTDERAAATMSRTAPIPGMLASAPGRLTVTRSLVPHQQFLARIRWSLAALGVVFAALTMMLGNWLSNRITRPVDQLLRASENLERGDYEAPVRVHTGDELEALASTFDSMRQSLHRQITALSKLDQMKSDFIGIASHELRTPVSLLQSSVELLAMQPPESMREGGEHQPILEALQSATQRLGALVAQITDMSLLDRREMDLAKHPVNLAMVLARVAAGRGVDCAARKQSLSLEAAASDLPVLADERRAAQVLDNLLVNAIRFTPDGGHIVLRGELRGAEVIAEVQDNGIGIGRDILDHIFDPFFEGKSIDEHSSGTTEFNAGGLGTGLAISRHIVEAHGGRIEVDSVPGKGSVFRLVLPRFDAAAVKLTETDMAAVAC